MTEDEREAIWQQAFENIAKRDDEADELAARREQNLGHVAPEDPRERFLRRRAARPPKPAPKLDIDLSALIDAKIADEREYWHAVIAETLALERRDVDERLTRLEILERDLERRTVDADACAKLSDDARKLKAEIATLQRCIEDLRGTVAHEADLPNRRYPYEIN